MWRPHLLAIFAMLIGSFCAHASPITTIAPAQMPKVGAVDPAFVSYNIEMVEVTGGRFWKPYDAPAQARHDAEVSAADPKQQGRQNADLYQYRPPIDLSNSRLRNLARAIGPAYVRVSGSWANTTFFQDDDNPPLKEPPAGFNQVLTRAEWKGVMDFARSVGAQMVTSFAVSPGTRDPEGVWMPEQARALMQFTRHSGGRLAAVEFMNEPTVAALHGAPKDYDAAAFAKDIAIFRVVLRQQAPGTLLLGPGGTAEGRPINLPVKIISSEAFLKATGPIFDALSYHFYGATSSRCVALGRGHGIKIDQALSAEWLARTDTVVTFYSGLRDTYLPGKPLWVTETAEAACAREPQSDGALRIYAHCAKHERGGVAIVALNTSDEGRTLQLPTAGERFTLTAPGLNSVKVLLNGAELLARVDGRMPTIGGEEIHSGTLQLAAQSITFIRMPSASNSNCR